MENVGVKFKNYNIFCDKLDTLSFSSKVVINTINQYSYCIAEQDPLFKSALINSDVLLPDGIGIVLAIKASSNQVVKKISGTDVHKYLLNKLNTINGSCFYLGSSDSTLKRINNKLVNEYPNITSSFFSPPFKSSFTEDENEAMIQKINSNSPDVLFIGMTAPKQEKWAIEHKDRLNVKIICSIGAVFDFYAGTIKRPQDMWVNMGLEWFIRLCKEPKRMWKRYVYYGPIFMFDVVKEMFNADMKAIYLPKKNIL